jgi:hypothetical protein
MDLSVKTRRAVSMARKPYPSDVTEADRISERNGTFFMKEIVRKAINNELLIIRVNDAGVPVCPVCGFADAERFSESDLPWLPMEGTDDPHFYGSDGFCNECGTNWGLDDCVGPEFPIGALKARWEELRNSWLDRNHWADRKVEQVQDNLGIVVDRELP